MKSLKEMFQINLLKKEQLLRELMNMKILLWLNLLLSLHYRRKKDQLHLLVSLFYFYTYNYLENTQSYLNAYDNDSSINSPSCSKSNSLQTFNDVLRLSTLVNGAHIWGDDQSSYSILMKKNDKSGNILNNIIYNNYKETRNGNDLN